MIPYLIPSHPLFPTQGPVLDYNIIWTCVGKLNIFILCSVLDFHSYYSNDFVIQYIMQYNLTTSSRLSVCRRMLPDAYTDLPQASPFTLYLKLYDKKKRIRLSCVTKTFTVLEDIPNRRHVTKPCLLQPTCKRRQSVILVRRYSKLSTLMIHYSKLPE
jgi:hypothetical protein